mgnify:CR=1 FL=1
MKLQELPPNDALILETIRSAVSSIANEVLAAQRCVQVESEASQTSPRTGGCQSILLDDIMSNYSYGLQQ